MDKLFAIKVFTSVVKENNFANAAEQLNLSAPMVSRYIAWLEKSLGVRLINRTTRRFSLTEAGTQYYNRATQILDALAEADHVVTAGKAQPKGTLRISVAPSFGQEQMIPVITQFLKTYPETSIELHLADRLVNLVEEGFDLGIRITQQLDAGLVARKLCACKSVLCAAPTYLKKFGKPKTLLELAQHECLILPSFLRHHWQFQQAEQIIEIEVHGRLEINDIQALLNAAILGTGITYQPTYLVGKAINSGKLQVIELLDCKPIEPSIYALYPTRTYLPAKVRAFVDALVSQFSPQPPWDKEIG